MGDFSQRAMAIQPTGVRKMFDLAGDDVISFGLGEPDFQPPALAIEAFTKQCSMDEINTRRQQGFLLFVQRLQIHGAS
jgi:aspartate/methionine/tyrosine aminotransferase